MKVIQKEKGNQINSMGSEVQNLEKQMALL